MKKVSSEPQPKYTQPVSVDQSQSGTPLTQEVSLHLKLPPPKPLRKREKMLQKNPKRMKNLLQKNLEKLLHVRNVTNLSKGMQYRVLLVIH